MSVFDPNDDFIQRTSREDMRNILNFGGIVRGLRRGVPTGITAGLLGGVGYSLLSQLGCSPVVSSALTGGAIALKAYQIYRQKKADRQITADWLREDPCGLLERFGPREIPEIAKSFAQTVSNCRFGGYLVAAAFSLVASREILSRLLTS